MDGSRKQRWQIQEAKGTMSLVEMENGNSVERTGEMFVKLPQKPRHSPWRHMLARLILL